ncbi:HIT family protein [Simiduia sp. 21SJ11W-1]|uniref:HIT family protein n=1 Tax=Simiduia sp. 21SJ11W-1 TaxID=2909669 RepID=UPI00209DBEC5|nr:HIT family protein [Simiduia sp. 21SJ11W-1]UTA46685.1 HIT family protein [Simiduia sp. 21SJ11W-1]
MFSLHPQLAQDSLLLGRMRLCQVRLSLDANYPWCLLIPERANVTEIHHLSEQDRHLLMDESCRLAEVMVSVFDPKKINVAALGNMVPQLHMHHVARFEDDAAWPGPIWGRVPALGYEDAALNKRRDKLVSALVGEGFTPAE